LSSQSKKESRKAQVWIGVRAHPDQGGRKDRAKDGAKGANKSDSPGAVSSGALARVLLFRVIPKRGGGWHPVTGGVDPEESFLQGAKRELQEETGFDPKAGEWIDLEFSYAFEGRFGRAQEHAFGFILPEELLPEIDSSEHSAFEWVSVEEALGRVGFDSQRDALKLFLCYLR
jgi:8-oxo-dGTP pyrophosphatase MutT (NUDIX family)